MHSLAFHQGVRRSYPSIFDFSDTPYGYFGKGSTGYAQYMTAFRRSRKGGGGGGGSRGGCFLLLLGGLAVLAVIEALVTA